MCAHVCMFICLSAFTNAFVYMYTRSHLNVQECVYVFICANVCVCVFVLMRIHVHLFFTFFFIITLIQSYVEQSTMVPNIIMGDSY